MSVRLKKITPKPWNYRSVIERYEKEVKRS